MHSGIGSFDQSVEIGSVGRKHRNAYRWCDHQFQLAYAKGCREDVEQSLRHPGCLGSLRAEQDHDEGVAADSSNCVVLARQRMYAFPNLYQQRVADRLTEGIIDVLELIDVQNQNGQEL